METWSVRQIAENRWQLFRAHDDTIMAEGTLAAVLAAHRLLGGEPDAIPLAQGNAAHASIESQYARLQTLTPDDFAVRSR